MKLSLEWLKQYVDLSGLTPDEISHKLTMTTAEVEGFDTMIRSVKGIISPSILYWSTYLSIDSPKLLNIHLLL